jgi:hypothetical protein
MREQQINTMTTKLLARLNPPRAISSNAEGIKAEAELLCKTISKMAPSREYQQWFDLFEEAVLSNLETRTWPTIKELKRAAKEIAPKRPEFRDLTNEPAWHPDPYKINAQRIKNMESVGEEWISGKQSDQLISRGLIEESDLDPYRSYLAHSALY